MYLVVHKGQRIKTLHKSKNTEQFSANNSARFQKYASETRNKNLLLISDE